MYERFEMLLAENDCKVSDVSKATGILPSTFSSWKLGRYTPKRQKMELIAEYFDVDLNWLMGASDVRKASTVSSVKIPVFGRVAAGMPILANEDIVDYEEIPSSYLKRGEYFGVRIKGESMSPLIDDGDIVIVHQQPDADSGSIVIALINGEEGVCKKLIKRQDGIVLKSINPDYGSFTYSNTDAVTICGKVEQLRRNFN